MTEPFNPGAWLESVRSPHATTPALAHALSEHADDDGRITIAGSRLPVISGLNRKEATLSMRELRRHGYVVLVAVGSQQTHTGSTYQLSTPDERKESRHDRLTTH